MYFSQLLIPPAVEPIQLDHLKAHLRVQHNAENGLLMSYLTAEREDFEEIGNRAIVAQTRQLTLPYWPSNLRLDRPPLLPGISITYRDTLNTVQTLAVNQYEINAFSPRVSSRIFPAYNKIWPTLYPTQGAVTIQFVAGCAVPVTVDPTTNVFTASGYEFANDAQITFSLVAEDAAGMPSPLSASRLYYVIGASGAAFQVAPTAGGSMVNILSPGSGQLFVGRIPEGIRSYLKLMVANRYENREPVNIGNITSELPLGAESLFWAHRSLEAV